MKKILVLTSGGDAPGMNAAIRAVVRTGHFLGAQVYGCSLGFQGLIEEKVSPLDPEDVANIIQFGGTVLKTGRSLDFLNKSIRDKCRQFIEKQAIDSMIVIGGDGSFRGAALLSAESDHKLAVIGIPSTIDNDIHGTEYTIGFDTARNTALQAIDKIRDTASSHDRNFLVEVMGRESGFLALDVGIAGGAEFILLPEFPISTQILAEKIMAPRRNKLNSIIVVAEDGEPGKSMRLAKELEALTGLAYRVCMLGHTQRGGAPTTLDRQIASSMGYMAVKGLLENISHKMVAMNNGALGFQAFPDPALGPRVLTDRQLIDMNDILCS